MNMELYERWLKDAHAALTATVYTEEQAEAILDFFRRIKGSAEIGLIGTDRMDAYMIYSRLDDIKDFSVYNSMMARMWTYAPYILKEEGLPVDSKWEIEQERKRKEEFESYRRR